MSDAVIQTIVTGGFGVIVALITQWGMKKSANSNANQPSKQGGTTVSEKLSFMRTGVFILIVIPVVTALLGLGLFLGGFNGVQAVAGAGPVPLKAPFSISGYFYPSGFMGDIKQIELNTQWTDNCHPGPTCIRAKYTPGQISWAGVYWQYPASNWGDQPSRKIEGAKKLVFWARGQVGGELVSFRVGGIQGKKYQDSLDRGLEPNPVRLTTQWQQYQIDLDGADMSSVIGAFSWSVARDGNPQGATFYLDGISFK
jgi:hypothetical protein